MLYDSFHRRVEYVRLSVTDRCDFRCRYCIPDGFRGFRTPGDALGVGEIARLVAVFAGLGVSKVRLTGGEPLVRKDILAIARAINATPDITDLALSTNGSQLARHAEALRSAGVERINVSLDSLDPVAFRQITGGRLELVLQGLHAAKAAGMSPIKINMVVMAGVNEHAVEPMVEYAAENGFALRLIETMPVGSAGAAASGRYLDLEQVRERLDRTLGLEPAALRGSGPARYYHVRGSGLVIGFITPLSRHFCASCNRVRLGADGALYPCLGSEQRLELRPLLDAGASDEQLREAIRCALQRKPARHTFTPGVRVLERGMSSTGG